VTVVEVVTKVKAPAARCFDLSRDIDFHLKSMEDTGERAVAGRTSGLIELGEEVTWEAKHLGVKQRFTSRITALSRPTHFRDEMVKGAFKSFVHDHHFEEQDGATTMRDVLQFSSPFGFVGSVVDRIFMTGYLERLIVRRCEAVKRVAERQHAEAEQPG
jgi:ligand-binding SRPBCC domain-containing protein